MFNAEIHDAMSELLGHINRHNRPRKSDCKIFQYNPFYPVDPTLRCLHAGISSIEGKEKKR